MNTYSASRAQCEIKTSMDSQKNEKVRNQRSAQRKQNNELARFAEQTTVSDYSGPQAEVAGCFHISAERAEQPAEYSVSVKQLDNSADCARRHRKDGE